MSWQPEKTDKEINIERQSGNRLALQMRGQIQEGEIDKEIAKEKADKELNWIDFVSFLLITFAATVSLAVAFG